MTIRFSFPGLPDVEGGAFQVVPTDVADFRFRSQTDFGDHSQCELDVRPRLAERCHSVDESDLVVDGWRMSYIAGKYLRD